VRTKDLVLPALIVAFTALAVTFLRPYLTLTVRWAALAIAFLYLLVDGRLFRPARSTFGLNAFVFGGWCALSAIWSEVWELSALKGFAFVLVQLTCLAGGFHWVRDHKLEHTLHFLLPLLCISTLAAVLGRFDSGSSVQSGPTVMYQGMVSGPNMFGAMLAMCSPLLIWQCYLASLDRSRRKTRLFWWGISALLFVFLVMSRSRGATLVVFCGVGGLFWSGSPHRRLQLIILAIGLMLAGYLASTELARSLTQFIYKAPDASSGVLNTRINVWEESLELALKGGVLGGGYGVTIGETGFVVGLTAIGYGREKGNSQLAVMEELGLIGVFLYSLVVFSGLRSMSKGMRSAIPGAPKALSGIVAGTFLGMLLQSIFEAWWVAPGSPECVYFWVIAGVGLGLSSDTRMRVPAVPHSVPDRGIAMTYSQTGTWAGVKLR
jgi:hypothetical protein